MSRRYLFLLAGTVLLAVALTWLGRPRPATEQVRAEEAIPVAEVTVVVGEEHVTSAPVAVPKGHRVRLRVEHRGAGTARLALAGYEDRLVVPELAPGGSWRGEFLADRPGEDFAWLLDGRPAGRFAVTGSHLVEGHR